MSDKATKRSALIIAALNSFIAPFMLSAVNIALPVIQKEFSVHAVVLTWVATSYILATAIFFIPSGKIADIYGRRKIFIYGTVIFTISTFLCVFIGSIEGLLVLRIIQGIGGAMTVTTGMTIIISVFPLQERGKAIGINTASVYVGLSAGPFAGGLITQYLHWKAIFLIAAILGLVSFILTLSFIKEEWADAKGDKFDLPGSIIYGLSLIIIMYGVSILPAQKAIIFISAGIICFITFVIYELRAKYPVFEMRLFKNNRVFTFSSLAALINYSATFAVTFLLSLYLQYILGMSPQAAGFILVVQPVMQTIFAPISGKLSDKIEPAIITSTGMAFTVIGLFLFIFLSPATTAGYIIGVLILLGIGFGFFSSPNTNAIMSSVEKKYYGVASGSVGTMRTIGMTLSMAITTVIFAVFMGQEEITPETYGVFGQSIKISFIIFTVLCVIGIYFSSARGNLERK